MRTFLRSKVTLLFIVCAALLAFAGTAMALTTDTSGSTSPAPTIQSDLPDYSPGDTVTLSGSNWQPGEVVHINVNDNQTQPWSRDVDVTADANGNITDQFQLPTGFAALYNVTATGATSGTATTTFTDGQVRVGAVGTAGAQPLISWTRYNTTNCTGTAADSGSFSAGTSGNGTTIQDASGNMNLTSSQSLKLTAGPVNAQHTFTGWSPAADFTTGTFTSTSNPGCLKGANGALNEQVNYSNQTPVAANQSLSTPLDTSKLITLSATDADTDALTYTVTSRPANGKLYRGNSTAAADEIKQPDLPANLSGAQVTFVPNTGFTGSTSFQFSATDGSATSNLATVTINVVSNTAPTAVDDTYNATEDTQLTITAPGVLGNDTDAQNNSLTAVLVSGPSHAAANGFTLNANGSFSYTPAANYNGADSFTYKANDGTVDSASAATVTINVASVDDPPVAVNDSATVQEDAAATAIDVLANDTNDEVGPKTISSASDPANGTVALTGGTAGAHTGLTYKPDANYCNDPPATNLDTFTYTLNGGSQATVSVKVTCVNDAPTQPGTITSDESLNKDGTFTLSWGASTDVDSANFTYTLEQKDNDDANWSEVANGLTSTSYTFGGSNPAELEGLWDFRVKAVDDYSPPASSDYREDLDLVKVDQTNPNAPTLSFATTGQSPKVAVGSVDWYKDSVKIDVTANGDPVNARDGSPGSGVDAASFPASFSVTTNGNSTASKTVKDNATNESSAGTLEVNVDAANPTFGNCQGGPFLVNSGSGTQSVTISASDGESGIDSANSQLTKSVDTSSAGTKTVTFKAQDRVGHSVTKNCDYTVRAYDFIGFTSPVDNPTVLNTVKAGQAVPLKWRLMDNGSPVTNLQSVTVTASSLSCSLGTSTDLLEEVASGSSGLQNLGDGYYQYNWKSPTSYAKSCKTLQINGVGMQLTAQQQPLFQFTK